MGGVIGKGGDRGADAGAEREGVETAVRRYGRTAFSFDALQCRERYAFFASRAAPGALVPYRRIGGADVVVGEPLAPAEAMPEVVREFLAARRAAGRRVLGILATEEFARAGVAAGAAAAQLTSEPELDPMSWEPRGGSAKKLRVYLRRLRREGVVATALPAGTAEIPGPFRRAADALVSAWLSSGARESAHLLELDPWRRPEEKRYFAVFDSKDERRMHALLVAHPVYAAAGWHLCHLVRDPAAPKGMSELVVTAAVEALGEEGVRYATFGALGDPRPGPFLATARWSAALYGSAYRLAALAGGHAKALEFPRKFVPGPWRPRYMVFDPARALARGFWTVMRVTHALPFGGPG
jgi:lysylphosphatidylglycerol synthetase-like protein (DUF2156 family)